MADPASRRDFFSRLLAAGLAVLGWRPRPLSAAPTAPLHTPPPPGGSFEWSSSAVIINHPDGATDLQTFTWKVCDPNYLPGAST